MSKALKVLQSQVTELLQTSKDQTEIMSRILELLEAQQEMFLKQMNELQKEQNQQIVSKQGWSKERLKEVIEKTYNFLTVKTLRENLSRKFEGVSRELTSEIKDLKGIVSNAFNEIVQCHQQHKKNISDIIRSREITDVNELTNYKIEKDGRVVLDNGIQRKDPVQSESIDNSTKVPSNVIQFSSQVEKKTLRDILIQYGKQDCSRISSVKLNSMVVEHGIIEKNGKATLKYKLENDKRFGIISLGTTEKVQNKSEVLAR